MATQSKMFAMENEVIKRVVPSSGEAIPVIGVGTNRYGVGNDQSARAPLKAALAKFHELGGTVIDTAPTYGSSEVVLGELISELGIQKDLFLASKVDRRNINDNTAGFHESFKRFDTKKFDLMQVHNFKDWENSLAFLKEQKAAGTIRYIGMTTHMPSQYDLMEKRVGGKVRKSEYREYNSNINYFCNIRIPDVLNK